MINYRKLKSKNLFLKFIFFLINFTMGFIVGIINLFIDFGKWIYRSLTKKYKYECLYIAIISAICIAFCIAGLLNVQKEQLYTWMGNSPSFVFIILLSISSITFVGGIIGYILTIFKKKSIPTKLFWYVRAISYFVTILFVLFLTDFVILDFISRYQLVENPKNNENASSYDVIIYFLKEYKGNFFEGIKVTISLALLGTVIGLILAFGLVSLRMLTINPRDNDLIKFIKKIGCGFAKVYVTVIRGTPMIVQAFIFYFLVLALVRPSLSLSDYRDFIDNVWTPFRAGLFTVSINTTAYLTEVLRGGLNSVDKGQKEAAEALGLGKFKTMMLIVFPQALKNSLPSIGNEFIVNIKDTSVLTLIGVLDLFSVSKNDILGVFSGKSLEAYLIVAAYYLILTYLTSKLLQYFEKRMNLPVKEIVSSN